MPKKTRSRSLRVRVTEQELQAILRDAKKEQMQLSEYVRFCILGNPKFFSDEFLDELVVRLAKKGQMPPTSSPSAPSTGS